MKLNITILGSFLLLFIGACTIRQAVSEQTAQKLLKFQLILDSIYQAHPAAVGLLVHVESPMQRISWSGGVGYSDKEKKTRLKSNQPALIASNTKTYVAATMLRLVEMGKLRLDQPIGELLSPGTKTLLIGDGYKLEDIQVQHLLSHTSGIFDYVNADPFFATVKKDPMHRWTRDEQIALAVSDGAPLWNAGGGFSYADTNFSLLTEIMEQLTGKTYYQSMRKLLNYERHGLRSTWFYTQEKEPKNISERVHQYAEKFNINTYQLDPSFDLYGGGGIAASTKDLARFSQLLFNGRFFKKPETLDLIYTKVPLKNQENPNYSLGLSSSKVNSHQAYGHGGFWGTVVQYFPDFDTSIAVFVLEKDKAFLRKDIMEALVEVL